MKSLKLEVIFGSKNHLSPALKTIIGSSNAASKALKKTRDEIKSLNDQQKKIDGYTKQKKATEDSAKALKDLQTRIKEIRRQMATNPSAGLTKEFDQAVAKAKKLKQQYEQNRVQLQRMRTEMTNSGLSTNRLAEHQQRLRTQLNQSNQSMHEQEQRLRRMTQMQQNYQRSSGHLRNTAMYGMGAAMTGAGALYAMRKPIDESKHLEIEENRIASLGLGKEATKEAILYAKAMQTFGTSTLDNLGLVRDGVTAFADVHHAQMVAPTLAKMKFANEAMYGDGGAENEKKFMDMLKVIEMRNGLKSEAAFKEQANIIQQVITATGGRVQAEEWLNVIKTGGIAAKGIDNKAFYYKLEPLVQEMGGFRVGTAMMSAYQNIYQGRTTKRAANNLANLGLIADPKKVQHDKSGQISFLDVGAIKGAELFKKDQFAWMEQVLVPQLKAKGITKEGDIIDAMGSIFTNRTAANLFAQMYMQRDQIHKNAKLNEGADTIDQLNTKAMGTTSGKELDAKAKLHNAYLTFGQTILPIYTRAIEIATVAMQGFTGWMERNPTLAKLLGAGLLTIAVSLVAIGAGLAVFSPLILGMLSLRLIMASASTGSTVLAKTFSILPKVFNVFKFALLGIGKVFMWLGRLMLTNPIVLAITAIAAAAYLIYKNWAPIKTFFIDVWAKVTAAFQSGINWIKGIIQSVDTVFANNPILNFLLPIIGIPRMIIANWSSISEFFGAIWGAITSATGIAVNAVSSLVSSGFNTAKNAVMSIWNGIKSIVLTAWQGICNIFSSLPILPYITNAFNAVMNFLSGLYSRMMALGSNIIQGLIDGIKSKFEGLKSIWATVNSWMPDFTRKTMDIHSPSRVMAELGSYIMAGLGVGLDKAFPGLRARFSEVLGIFKPNNADALQKINVAPALSKITSGPSHLVQAQSGTVIQGDTITLHIHAQPGQTIQELKNMVESIFDKRSRQKQAQIRNSFSDFE